MEMRGSILTWVAVFGSGCVAQDTLGLLVPPTADQDPSLPQVVLRVAGHERAVHLQERGDPSAPLLLMLHGSLGDHRAMLELESLAERYHVVFWDQRGNGLSERITADEYGWDTIIEEIGAVRGLFDDPGPVTLVGHSFGAMYASLYTSRRPDEVHQLVLMEPGGLTGEIFGDTFQDVIEVRLLSPGLSRAFWQSEVLSPSGHEAVDYKSLRLLLDGSATNYHCDPEDPVPKPVWRPGGHVEWLRGLAMRGPDGPLDFDFDFVAGIERFQGDTLLVAGSCSALGPSFQREHHLPLLPRAELVTIPRAGHRLWVEQPEAVLLALEGFLEPPR
jgi:proline iminopeptidase